MARRDSAVREDMTMLPEVLRPVTLGLHWGMPKAACVQHLGPTTATDSPGFLGLTVQDQGTAHDLSLGFDDDEKLHSIFTSLAESHMFFDEDEWDTLEEVEAEFLHRYHQAVAEYSRTLRAPAFSGDDVPELAQQVSNPYVVTYWDSNGDRVQLELSHEDKELPFDLALLCYPTPSTP